MKQLLQLVFFASGFAALLYQIIWQRILTFFGGADVFSVTLIVAAFMGGLGFGSLAGGYLADRLTRRGQIAAFAAVELGIALFGVVSPFVLYDLLYVQFGDVSLSRAVMAVILFGVLLWPTFLMGMSLPLLTRALTDDAEHPSEWVPILYGWNTVGAACGALIGVWVVFRTMSFADGLRIAAAINTGCAATALVFATRRNPTRRIANAVDARELSIPLDPTKPAMFSLYTWALIYTLSGFIALSLEIIWFRVLGVLVKSNAFSFGSLLAVYLLGVGLGALVTRSSWLHVRSPAKAFFGLQAGVTLYAVASLAILVAVSGRLEIARPLWTYMAGYEPATLYLPERSMTLLLTLYGLLPAYLMGPPTLMMGLSFGFLQQAVQTDLNALGRRVGVLQMANIAGSLLGTVLTGLLSLQWWGSSGSLRALTAMSGLFLILFAVGQGVSRRSQVVRVGAAVLATGTAIVLVPSSTNLWAALHATEPDRVIVAEDRSGLSLITGAVDNSAIAFVFANGLGQGQLPFGSIHTVLGSLSVLLHPAPRSVAVIGLGSGDTLFASGLRPETRVLESIEIIAPELTTLEVLRQRQAHPDLEALLADRRIRHTFTDGRAYIRRGGQQYDVIEADALRPNSAFSGNLYSVEYFELVRDHLSEDGLAVTWAPTLRIRHSFVKVFPYALRLGTVLIGSKQMIRFNPEEIRMRLSDPFTRAYFARAAIDITSILEPFLVADPIFYGPEVDRSQLLDFNRDLFPKDEFMLKSHAELPRDYEDNVFGRHMAP